TGTGKMIQAAKEVNLCRCGKSENKPFCDGSHVSAGFKAT
ncbi:MAG: CDGSH iron-sulfur domain-containing protein, partial [Bdellovibrionota bacterium]